MIALFVMVPTYGHLNATYRLARQLQTEGYQIVYALDGSPELAQMVKQQGFSVHWLQSQPFGVGLDEVLNQTRTESYLETFLDRISGRDIKARTADWQRTLSTLKPTLILLDAFLSTDFVLLYPLLSTYPAKVVTLQTMLSAYDDGLTPPLNSSLIPGQSSQKAIQNAWKRHYRIRAFWHVWQTIKYVGYSHHRQVHRAFRKNGLPELHRLRDDKLFHAGIDNVSEWILAPHTFDFAQRKLLPHQQYLGLMPDLNRTEDLPPAYQTLMAQLAQERLINPNIRIIYASLGTVTEAHTKPRDVLRFFTQLLQAVATQPDWRLILAISTNLKNKLSPFPATIFPFERVPQVHLLPQCNLFITHGGLNSVLEGHTLEIPMLIYPLNRRWDQPGNAARIVAQGKGVMGNLRKDSATSISHAIRQLLTSAEKKSEKFSFTELKVQ